MSFLKAVKSIKDRLVQEVDLMLTEAENNTPNLRKPMKYERDPATLQPGDDIMVIEYRKEDQTYTDLFGNPYYKCLVISVDTISKTVKLQLKDNPDAVDTIPFKLSRFFLTSDIKKLDEEHNRQHKHQEDTIIVDDDDVIIVDE